MTGADIVRAARAWIGVRYAHQGRSREGVDCIGLPVCVRADLGLPALDAAPGYARTSAAFEMLDFCKANMREISADQLQPGDILVQVSGNVRHMAIVGDYPGGGLSIIHAYLPNRRVLECRIGDEFLRSVRGCFRFLEVVA